MSAEAWGLGRHCLLSWQAWHLQHLRFHLRGRRATFSTYIDVCGSVAPGTSLRFVVAGVPCAWQACYFQCLHRCLRCVLSWQAWHLQHRRFHWRGKRATFSTYLIPIRLRKRGAWDAAAVCRGRRGTCSAAGSICVAGVLLSVPT